MRGMSNCQGYTNVGYAHEPDRRRPNSGYSSSYSGYSSSYSGYSGPYPNTGGSDSKEAERAPDGAFHIKNRSRMPPAPQPPTEQYSTPQTAATQPSTAQYSAAQPSGVQPSAARSSVLHPNQTVSYRVSAALYHPDLMFRKFRSKAGILVDFFLQLYVEITELIHFTCTAQAFREL